MAFCANCGSEIKEEYDFCPQCGQALRNLKLQNEPVNNEIIICKNCGEQMPADAFYCLCCGKAFDTRESSFEEIKKQVNYDGRSKKYCRVPSTGVWKNKWIALLLCFFFGIFGVHRFYEGKIISGLIYMFSFGLLGLGWFYDIIRLFIKPNPYRVK